MRAVIIVNPASGRIQDRARGGGSRQDAAARLARAAGVEVDVVATTARGHAKELARSFSASGYDRIVVWGGDGTINEAAGPLIGAGSALGIIPGGSGDGVARSLGVPVETERAVRLALTGAVRPVDVGWLGARHFLNIGGIGFDAEVAERFNRRARRGTRGYVADALRAVWSYRCARYEVAVNGRRFSGPHFLVAFANGREYGSGLVLVPTATCTDGWLDMVLVSGGGPLRQFWRARRLLVRRMAPAEGVWRERVAAATVTGDCLRCHVDGETFDTTGTLDVRIDPGALRVAGVAG